MEAVTFQDMSRDPRLGLTRDVDKGFEIIETERSPVAPRSGLILSFSLTFSQIVALMLAQRSLSGAVWD